MMRCEVALRSLAALAALAAGSVAAAAPSPTLVLLATRGIAPRTQVIAWDGQARVLGEVEHLPEASVRGAWLDGAVLVAADRAPGDYGAALVRVGGGRSTELARGLYHASRPCVVDGRIFVERGRVGVARGDALRVDALTLDEIDAHTGAVRSLWSGAGYIAHLGAVAGRELIVYWVRPDGATLFALDVDTGRVRTILPSLPPFARDFGVAGGTLVFANRDQIRSDRWTIERVDLASGAAQRLVTAPSQALAPYAWSGGEVVYNDDGQLRGLAAGRIALGELSPLPTVVRALSSDGAWAAALRYLPEVAIPEVVLVDIAHGGARLLPLDPTTHVDIVGFVGAVR